MVSAVHLGLRSPQPVRGLQVLPGEYPKFGLQGRGGRIYSWYGAGGISRSFVAAEGDAQARIAESKHFITAK